MIEVAKGEDRGTRKVQQDSLLIKDFGKLGVLAVVADGMGEGKCGEIASRIATQTFGEFVIDGDDIGAILQRFLLLANKRIKEYKSTHPECIGMGTTLLALFVNDEICQWISVGDSPLYVLRRGVSLTRLNSNHTVGALLDEQVKKGEISQKEAMQNPQRELLTSALTGDEIAFVDLSVAWSIKEGDIFVVATDGIEILEHEAIQKILERETSDISAEGLKHAISQIIRIIKASSQENRDNVAMILLGNSPKKRRVSKRELNEKRTLLPIYLQPRVLAASVLTLFVIGMAVFGFMQEPTDESIVTNSEKRVEKKEEIKEAEIKKSFVDDTTIVIDKTEKRQRVKESTKQNVPKEIEKEQSIKETKVAQTIKPKIEQKEEDTIATEDTEKKENQKSADKMIEIVDRHGKRVYKEPVYTDNQNRINSGSIEIIDLDR